VDTVARARELAPAAHVAILAGAHLEAPFRAALPDLPADGLWIEPRAKGTGPVLAWAAHRIHRADPAAVMISLHSDHVVHPESAFLAEVRGAASLAVREDVLLTIAAVPDRPETGYGYIRPGEPLGSRRGEPAAVRVDTFVEKPDLDTAKAYVARGYLWNTGIFVFPVGRFLAELRDHAPEIAEHLPLLDRGDDAGFFDAVPAIAVDEAVMERSRRVGAVRAGFEWDDVGGWEALARTIPLDENGNAFHGEVHAVDSASTVAWTEEGPIVLFGVEGLVVVRSGGVTMVTSRERAPALKVLLSRLPEALREGRIPGAAAPASREEDR
jgi:mannose-1-phosphate guanylyltransferase